MKIGCDPEIFLINAAGAFISSIGIIGGSKEQPRPLPIGDGYAVQEDNVALEFNIPPASSAEELDKNINNVLSYLSEEVRQHALTFSNSSAVSFPRDQLMHPKAMEFGCDPDFDAWKDGAPNPRPSAKDKALRTCGGHVHVGHKFNSRAEVISFIQYMDLYLGVPSVLKDNGELRKELYGKAGAFRFKPYGTEYRSLSNFWIFSKELRTWVFESTSTAMDAWQAGKVNMSEVGPYIQEAINTNNKQLAQELITTYA